MRLQTVNLADLTLDPKNARTHSKRNLETISNSLKQFGQVENIVVQAGSMRVIGGNGRVEAMRQAGDTQVEANVIECSDAQANKLALALNRTAQLAGWNKDVLADNVADLVAMDIEVEDIGFSEAELADLVGACDIDLGDKDDAAVEASDGAAVSKVGDIWQLGRHRLICGDSTCANHVNALMQGRDAYIMVTDPPYGVEYKGEWRSDARPGEITNDDKADWRESFAQFSGAVAYVWHGIWRHPIVQESLLSCDLIPRHVIIWNKSRQCMSRGAYHLKFEPCSYAVRKGRPAQWSGGRKQCDVWEIDSGGGIADAGEGDIVTSHPTQKPVECMARPMRNHGKRGDIAYEPFCGSGSSLIAAERTERVCRAVELEPKWVDVAVERWQNCTGGKAERVTCG